MMAFGFAVLACAFVIASTMQTRGDARTYVEEAVKFAKENGKDKFFDEIWRPRGRFHFQQGAKKGLYIFVYDDKGVILAHGVKLELAGTNRWDDKDSDGRYWFRDWTKLVHRNGSGWVRNKEYNPGANNRLINKWSFVELAEGMVIGCGVYEQ